MKKIRRALISVSDKRGIEEFGKGLKELGVEIVSTGGTAKVLEKAGVSIIKVSDVTHFPEMLGGRVKTLHPHIHAGILADRKKKEHLEEMKKQGIELIDLIVVNLYPFAQTIAKEGVTLEEAIENIDIGGPTMIRAAAKNFESVAVVVDPERYVAILEELQANDGTLTRETSFRLAKEAFEHTARYDTTIYKYLEPEEDFPSHLTLTFEKIQNLRYGENPHQQAAYYREIGASSYSLAQARQLQGKELSFNNILDLDAAWSLTKSFNLPTAVVIKHTNPCGVASAEDISSAYEAAHQVDPVSAFGSIVGVNRKVERDLAEKITATYVEAVIAPAYSQEALSVFNEKSNLRIMLISDTGLRENNAKDIKKFDGGILVQDLDWEAEDRDDMKVVTETQPTEEQWKDLLFAWKVVRGVKSNAIIFAKDSQAKGIGAGQMSRVDATELAIKKAGREACKDSVMASDAFFPFRDAVDVATKVGVKAIIQPGGSVRDEEVIQACNENKIAMVFTGKRHFRH